MPVQIAFQFIQHLRKDEKLKQHLVELHHNLNVDHVIQLGMQLGFVFTVEELETAHKHDWGMRWRFYQEA